jgi:GntR family transcriptional regulator
MTRSTLDGIGSLQEQVRRLICQEIASGSYPAGSQLPTEKEYAERLGVSLITVRNALASLVQVGYIERTSGRGTFVSRPKDPYEISLLSSTTASLRAAGVPFEIQVLVSTVEEPPEDVRVAMSLARGAIAYRLERVAVVRGAPAILLRSWVRRSASRAFERDADFAGGQSLYALLSGQGIKLTRAEGRVELVYANDREADLLRLPFGAPLFAYDSTTSDDRGRVVERARAIYDANRFSLTISPGIAVR